MRTDEAGGTARAAIRIALDPGSKAARYWAGFGAGAAKAKIEGEIVDAKTRQVFAKFTQERRSSVGMMGEITRS